jgi:hypothetical protein
MRINGKWRREDSGEVVPVGVAEIRSGDGKWIPAPFIVDTGAERTVFRYDLLYLLQLDSEPDDGSYLTGVGGESSSVLVATTLRLERDDGIQITINGNYDAFTDPIALKFSILCRDVLGNFALIVIAPVKWLLSSREITAIRSSRPRRHIHSTIETIIE